MTYAEKVAHDAIHEHWPPALLVFVLDKMVAEGIDLGAEIPRQAWPL